MKLSWHKTSLKTSSTNRQILIYVGDTEELNDISGPVTSTMSYFREQVTIAGELRAHATHTPYEQV